MSNEKQLRLYVRDYCMYCDRVLRVLGHLGVEIEVRNIWQNPDYERTLVGATGRRSVPVLEIVDKDSGSTWMPESADIVRYLESGFKPGSGAS